MVMPGLLQILPPEPDRYAGFCAPCGDAMRPFFVGYGVKLCPRCASYFDALVTSYHIRELEKGSTIAEEVPSAL